MSGFLTGMEVAASGLGAQRTRMNVISSNLANAETTRTAEGGPYRRLNPVFEAQPVGGFWETFDSAVRGVEVVGVEPDPTPAELVFDPGHPDANDDGYVAMPNVNVVEEMVGMIVASRSYEANATAFETLKAMAVRAMEIG